jgi:signal peptide peptidase-like protein 2B
LDHQQAPPQSQPVPPRRHAATPTANNAPQIQSMELTMWHAACFVVVASAMLMLLFFFEFYTAVTVLYGIGCSGAMAQLIFRPLYSLILSRIGKTYKYWGEQSLCPTVFFCGFNEVAILDVLAGVSGYTIGAAWLYVWFTSPNPSGNYFYWITQDIMGACICILFLSILRLNSIKVATVLLIAVFLYDIFFVFLTPYLFDGDSVMVTVATGGGASDQVSADYCEKYPNDADCKQGQPLPMLLTIPKINDFRGGANLLGLGDIVLPGLLTSFAARLDGAKMLVGGHTSLDVSPKPPKGGYLLYLTIAYAIGLLMAMIAVVLMERGQPALLYLVPTTLGTMLWLTRSEVKEMWKGPRVLKWADRLVRYCDSHRFAVTPQFGDAATEAGSIEDDDVIEEEHDLELNEEENDEHKNRYENAEVLGIVTENGSNRELT